MGNMTVLSLPWGGDVTFYAFLLALGALFAAVWVIYHAPRYDAGTGGAILYVLLAGVLGLFLGRAVYCAVLEDVQKAFPEYTLQVAMDTDFTEE